MREPDTEMVQPKLVPVLNVYVTITTCGHINNRTRAAGTRSGTRTRGLARSPHSFHSCGYRPAALVRVTRDLVLAALVRLFTVPDRGNEESQLLYLSASQLLHRLHIT